MTSESNAAKVNNIMTFFRCEVKYRGKCDVCELKFNDSDYINLKNKSEQIFQSINRLAEHIACEFNLCNYDITVIKGKFLGSLLENGVNVVKSMVAAITITTLKLSSILKLPFQTFAHAQVILDTALEAWKATLNSHMGAVVSIMWGIVKIKYVSKFEDWHNEICRIIEENNVDGSYVDEKFLVSVTLAKYFLKKEDEEWLSIWFPAWNRSREQMQLV
jgi:hypothetical protein